MRIIAGALRGRKLASLKDPGLRPISDRIKQSLFDIISGLVPGSRFLDLFAGTGAVGIEALSRGAASAFFVESNPRCLEVIRENLLSLGLSASGRAEPGNALGDLSWIPHRGGSQTFDLVFMGPPYKTPEKRPLSYSGTVLARLAESSLLAPQGWIICQHHVKEEIPCPGSLEMVRREKYGDSYLSFHRWK